METVRICYSSSAYRGRTKSVTPKKELRKASTCGYDIGHEDNPSSSEGSWGLPYKEEWKS